MTFGESNRLEGNLELLETKSVVVPRSSAARRSSSSTLTEIAVLGFISEMKVGPLLLGSTSDKVVEDVEVPLAAWCTSNTILLEVVLERLRTSKSTAIGELEFGVLSEPGSVRIEEGASVAERFEDEVGCWDLVSEFGPLLAGIGNGELENSLDG